MLEQTITISEQALNNAAQTQPNNDYLPSDWKVVQLGKVSDIVMGQSPPSSTYNSEGEGLPFLQGKSEFTDIFPRPTKYCSRPLKVAKGRTVLISVRAPVGDVNLADSDYIIGRGLASISLKEGDNWFLFYLLLYNKPRIAAQGSGTTFQSINRTVLDKLTVSLPPPSEQQAIANVLRTAQEAIQIRRDELDLEHERKAALMQHLFRYGIKDEPLKQTTIGEMPQSWQVLRLGEVFTTQLGKMLSPKAKVGNSPKPYIRNANVQWGYLDCSKVFKMDFNERESNKFRLEYGDILVCEGGEVGRTAIWRNELPECYFQKAIHRLRPRNGQMLPAFFLYHMERAFLYENIYGVAGTETTIAHLPQDKLVSMFIPTPPLNEQQVIAQSLEACDTYILNLQREITLLEELFGALLEELMTGRLSTLPLIEKGETHE